MSLPLEGLSAVVTGAGRGLGRAEAIELAGLGASVVVNDFGRPGRDGSGEPSAAPAEEVAEEIRAAGGQAVAHLGDVADFGQARELVELAVSRYGKLDILVNNAGILRDRMVFSMSEDEWDSVIRVHLKGHFNTTRFASAHWRERSKAAGGPVYGRIINTSSEAFLAGSAGQPNYAAAKGGIVGLTTSTALALGRYGVTANAICPRARTRMTEDVFEGFAVPEDGRLDPLAPEHVSPLVGYLASPASAGATGQLFVVHGGIVAVVERPRVAAKFDAVTEAFSYEELDELLSPYYEGRPSGETFAAKEVLGLKHAQ
ncbi:3-oxoacyl-ACP reductase [Streptomyces sp. NPDC051219]|uniref:3-oxoacyl-ACP reductase n=1 Tax=Streptomyces sp. NPDC051219 TaxID=3155283 RepID=UPI00343D316B